MNANYDQLMWDVCITNDSILFDVLIISLGISIKILYLVILMKGSPLVSVIIPTKNSSKTLSSCLDSIKNQDYENIEIIVVDNHSTDNTLEIAKRYTNTSLYIQSRTQFPNKLWSRKVLRKIYLQGRF